MANGYKMIDDKLVQLTDAEQKEYDARNRINEVINKQITLQQMLMEITAEQHEAGIEASH